MRLVIIIDQYILGFLGKYLSLNKRFRREVLGQ